MAEFNASGSCNGMQNVLSLELKGFTIGDPVQIVIRDKYTGAVIFQGTHTFSGNPANNTLTFPDVPDGQYTFEAMSGDTSEYAGPGSGDGEVRANCQNTLPAGDSSGCGLHIGSPAYAAAGNPNPVFHTDPGNEGYDYVWDVDTHALGALEYSKDGGINYHTLPSNKTIRLAPLVDYHIVFRDGNNCVQEVHFPYYTV